MDESTLGLVLLFVAGWFCGFGAGREAARRDIVTRLNEMVED